MTVLYLTADRVGIETGGGVVTRNEAIALRELAVERNEEFICLGRDELQATVREGETYLMEPWLWDDLACSQIRGRSYSLCHVYAGTFSDTVAELQRDGCRVVYTAAAHDVAVSRREHEKLGMPYHYPHITDPQQWQQYVAGYLNADALVCPSTHSANVMRGFGATKPIHVIPHGVDLPPADAIKPLPKTFTVGYLGSCGAPDKGVIYLLQAWKKLAHPDALLVLGGRDSTSPWVQHLVEQYGGSNIVMTGWIDSVADFYNRLSLLVQPSASEGFGIEVLEACAMARPVVCSDGAGAADTLPSGWRFAATNVDGLAKLIALSKRCCDHDMNQFSDWGKSIFRSIAEQHTWDKIRERYKRLWRSLL